MALWGKTDNAGSSVGWAAAQVNKTANSANRTDLFGNTTQGAFENNGVAMKKAVGQFGVDATEMGVSNGSIVSYTITFAGSGYTANAAVTVSGNATSNATATGGRISAVNVNTAGSGYTTIPSVTIAAPSAVNITANSTGFSNSADTILISTANSKFLVGDKVYYGVGASNTAIAPLTGNSYYFVVAANTTAIKLSETKGGTAINITDDRTTNPGETHTLTGETATAVAALSGARPAAHAGWVLRTVGQGGRAGRVQEETLVAMGSITGDAEDTIMKDS
jgi:hypothetical protein